MQGRRFSELMGLTALAIGCGTGFGCSSVSGRSLSSPPVVLASTTQNACSIRYSNVADSSGLAFEWSPPTRPVPILESMGGGVAFIDYDDDGWPDILLVSDQKASLFHNLHNGKFQDVSKESGIANLKGHWMGCAVADVDGDGRLDIILTGYQRLALLKNDGGKRFTDVTTGSGLDPANGGHWSLSAGFMDLSGNGHPDLILTNYVHYGPNDPRYCELKPGVKSGCQPARYKADYMQIWRNQGKGKFTNITAKCGAMPLHGHSMTVAFADVDGSGRMSMYIGNDGKPAEMLRNLGGMRFRNECETSGVAVNPLNHAIAAMGADWGDYDCDGRPDLAVTAFSDEPYSLYQNAGNGAFSYVSDTTGIMAPTYNMLGFGVKWLDMDNDGWPDIAFANGHVLDNADILYPSTTYRQSLMLFHNCTNMGAREFVDQAQDMSADVSKPIVGRGLATGDYDNDGRIDILVADLEGKPVLLHNDTVSKNHWITFDLRSSTGGYAYGAIVKARLGGRVLSGAVSPSASFLSSSDPRVHFGFGEGASLNSVSVRWPNGKEEEFTGLRADTIVRLRQGAGKLINHGGKTKPLSVPVDGSEVVSR